MDFSVDSIMSVATVYGMKFLGALAIFVLGRLAIKAGCAVLSKVMSASRVDATLVAFTGNVVFAIGLTFVIIAALGQLGIQTTSIAAVIGAAGLAIGLSLQNSLGNLASGVMIIALRPFKLGDVVDTAGKNGKVTDINIFTTELRSDDNKRIIIPNGKITNDVIVNHTV